MTTLITNHSFVQDRDGRCARVFSGERCGNGEDHHSPAARLPDRIIIDDDGHGWREWDGEGHWSMVPTTTGNQAVPEPYTYYERVDADALAAPESLDPNHEDTKRVLFHIVNSYQSWRPVDGTMPNELTDDAVRVGEQHLREIGWFPEDGGWLADAEDPTIYTATPVVSDSVLDLIDEELERLGDKRLSGGTKKWRLGVLNARASAAHYLKAIRDAYIVESIIRRADDLLRYDIKEGDADCTCRD